MSDTIWLIMLGGGLITFVTRLSFIALEGRYTAPRFFTRALPLVPIAALTALIVPDLLLVQGHFGGMSNPRLWAGLVAFGVAWKWKNPTFTIVAGFVALGVAS